MPLLPITVAGVTVGLELPSSGWHDLLMPRMGKFATERRPDMVVRIAMDPTTPPPGGEPRVEQDADGLHLRHDQFHGFLPPTGDAVLTIHEDGTEPQDLTYVMVLDSLMRICFAQLLAARGGLMFHAAGIAADAEAGYVFFGPSGSGKTTICKLSHPARRILCDEIIAVMPEGASGARLYGTPFSGAWGDSLAEDVPLRGMYWLKQAPHTRALPLDDATAVRGLLESAVAYDRGAQGLGQLLEAAFALVHRVHVDRLEFEPKETLWETVQAPRLA